MDANQYDFYIDLVLCIDATHSMVKLLDMVKEQALSFHKRLIKTMEFHSQYLEQLRVKVIAFRDYKADSEPMTESKFFTLPQENAGFEAFVRNIKPIGGGDIPENSLEAFVKALKSDWTTGGGNRRQIIVIFTDAPALALKERKNFTGYPDGMPETLDELERWWMGKEPSFSKTYEARKGRLILFVPEEEPWKTIQSWSRCWPVFGNTAGGSVDEIDIQLVIDMIISTLQGSGDDFEQ